MVAFLFLVMLTWMEGQTKAYLRAGVNYSSVYFGDYVFYAEPLVGGHGGVSLEWDLGEKKKWSNLTGVHYSMKGTRNVHDGSIPLPRNLKLNYLTIPQTINYSPFRGFYLVDPDKDIISPIFNGSSCTVNE